MESKEIFHGFSLNKNAIPFLENFLEEHPDKLDWIQWDWLSRNVNACSILEKHVDKINWKELSANCSPRAFYLIEKHFDQVKNLLNWEYFSSNPLAISLLEKNIDKIHWEGLQYNTNPLVANIMAKYPHKIKWNYFSYRIVISPLILANHDIINWKEATSNPQIFEIEDFLKKRVDLFREELMQQALHPRRVAHLLDQGGDLENSI